MNVESRHRSKKLKLEQTGVPGLSQTQGEDMAFGHAFFSDAANIGDIATPLFRKYQAAVNLFSQLVELWSVSTSSKPRTLDAVYDANENAWVEEDDKCLSTRVDAVTYGADGKVIDVINDDSSQPRIVVTEMDDQVRFALTGVVQFSVPLCRHTLLYWDKGKYAWGITEGPPWARVKACVSFEVWVFFQRLLYHVGILTDALPLSDGEQEAINDDSEASTSSGSTLPEMEKTLPTPEWQLQIMASPLLKTLLGRNGSAFKLPLQWTMKIAVASALPMAEVERQKDSFFGVPIHRLSNDADRLQVVVDPMQLTMLSFKNPCAHVGMKSIYVHRDFPAGLRKYVEGTLRNRLLLNANPGAYPKYISLADLAWQQEDPGTHQALLETRRNLLRLFVAHKTIAADYSFNQLVGRTPWTGFACHFGLPREHLREPPCPLEISNNKTNDSRVKNERHAKLCTVEKEGHFDDFPLDLLGLDVIAASLEPTVGQLSFAEMLEVTMDDTFFTNGLHVDVPLPRTLNFMSPTHAAPTDPVAAARRLQRWWCGHLHRRVQAAFVIQTWWRAANAPQCNVAEIFLERIEWFVEAKKRLLAPSPPPPDLEAAEVVMKTRKFRWLSVADRPPVQKRRHWLEVIAYTLFWCGGRSVFEEPLDMGFNGTTGFVLFSVAALCSVLWRTFAGRATCASVYYWLALLSMSAYCFFTQDMGHSALALSGVGGVVYRFSPTRDPGGQYVLWSGCLNFLLAAPFSCAGKARWYVIWSMPVQLAIFFLMMEYELGIFIYCIVYQVYLTAATFTLQFVPLYSSLAFIVEVWTLWIVLMVTFFPSLPSLLLFQC